MDTRPYNSTAGNRPCVKLQALYLCTHMHTPFSIAQVLRTSSRRWGTSRHTAQRKASGAATAEQQMSYAYPALAPHHVRSSRKAYREGAVRALARGQYASLARPSLATHAVRCLRVCLHHHASVGSLHETAKETEPAARGRCGARSSRQGLKGSVCYVQLW